MRGIALRSAFARCRTEPRPPDGRRWNVIARERAEFRIRRANAGDIPALISLFYRARVEAFHWRPRESFDPSDFLKETAGETIEVALDREGTVLGFIAIWEPERFVHHLFVDPDHQRRGVGSLLLAGVRAWLPQPHRLKCVTANHSAYAFYIRHGWRELERRTNSPVEPEHALMEWQQQTLH